SQLMLCLVGYFLPLSLCALYYFWMDGLDNFLDLFLFSRSFADPEFYISYQNLATLLIFPLIFTILGFILIPLLKRLTVNQQKQNQLIVLFFVFASFSLFFIHKLAPYQLIIVLPGIAYFISQIFVSLRNKRLKMILFNLYFLSIPLMGYGWTYRNLKSGELDNYVVNTGTQYDF